jgi:UDP-glucuronate 4-epimerase
VRYGLIDPGSYTRSNLVAHQNILEFARHHRGLQHLIYASSSSVYGNDSVAPFSEDARADKPISYYGATKRSGELLSHSYAELFGLKQTGLRFFTVYGPWGRPDMVLFKFTKAILEGQPINVFNHGHMKRDFTYVDDVVESVIRIMNVVPAKDPKWSSNQPDPSTSVAPYRLYNVGNQEPVDLLEVIALLEAELGKSTTKNLLPMQPGDVAATHADVTSLQDVTGFTPRTTMREGIRRFVGWYKEFYGLT